MQILAKEIGQRGDGREEELRARIQASVGKEPAVDIPNVPHEDPNPRRFVASDVTRIDGMEAMTSAPYVTGSFVVTCLVTSSIQFSLGWKHFS